MLASIILRLSISSTLYIEVEQMNVKTTFLHGDMEEEMFMKQLEGFSLKGKKEWVCRLNKSFDGLK